MKTECAWHHEIDELNKELAPFKIFKGIESDILYDGQLDYDDDVLSSFDFIVASVHSQLKMNKQSYSEVIDCYWKPLHNHSRPPYWKITFKERRLPDWP